MKKFIEVPIVGGIVAIDQIAAVRLLLADYQEIGGIGYGVAESRVVIDTKQVVCAFCIPHKDVEDAEKTQKEIVELIANAAEELK